MKDNTDEGCSREHVKANSSKWIWKQRTEERLLSLGQPNFDETWQKHVIKQGSFSQATPNFMKITMD